VNNYASAIDTDQPNRYDFDNMEVTMNKKIVRLPLLITVAALFVVLFAACGGKTSNQQSGELTLKPGVLMIGMNLGYPPMEYVGPDGTTPTGFSIEMGKVIAERLGLQPEFINTAWDGIFAGLDARRWDVIISSATVTPERQEAHNFSKPYIANTLAMVVRRGSNVPAKSPSEVAGLNVGFQGATTADFFMEGLARDQGFRYNVSRYPNMSTAFIELELGRVDIIVTDLVVALGAAAESNVPFDIVWVSEDADPEVFAVVLRKGADTLTQAIDTTLEGMFDDGTMLRISNEIFGNDFVTAARHTW